MNLARTQDILALWKIARYDPKSCEIGQRYDEQENLFAEMVAKLKPEQQDIAWGFVCTSDELNHRLLEWICECFGIDPLGYLDAVVNGEITLS